MGEAYLLVRVGPRLNLSSLCSEAGDCLEASCLPTVQTGGPGGVGGGVGGVVGVPSATSAVSGAAGVGGGSGVNGTSSGDPLMDRFLAAGWPVADWTYFDEDYLRLVNRHWLAFPPPSRQAHLLVLAVYSALVLAGMAGNAIVLFMIARCRSLRTPSNLLILNLALSDFLMISKSPVVILNSYKGGPYFGSIGCQIYGLVGGLTGTGSIMTLAAIALDRYYVIAYPLNREFHTTKLRALIWIILIWIYSFFFSVIPVFGLFGVKPYIPEGYLTSCSFDYLDESPNTRYFILTFFCAAWVVPCLIIAGSYAGIWRAVLVVSVATRLGQEREKRKKELKLALVVMGVVGLWFIAWTPYAVVALLGIFGRHDVITPGLSMVPAIFCKSASCIDPFLYSLNHPRLRSELVRIFCPKRYEMTRIETQKSLYNIKESRSSLNLKDTKSRAYREDEQEVEGGSWKRQKVIQRSESLNSEIMIM